MSERAAGPGVAVVTSSATDAPGARLARAGVVVLVKVFGSPAGGMTVTTRSRRSAPCARSGAEKSSPNRNSRRTGTVDGEMSKVETLRIASTLAGIEQQSRLGGGQPDEGLIAPRGELAGTDRRARDPIAGGRVDDAGGLVRADGDGDLARDRVPGAVRAEVLEGEAAAGHGHGLRPQVLRADDPGHEERRPVVADDGVVRQDLGRQGVGRVDAEGHVERRDDDRVGHRPGRVRAAGAADQQVLGRDVDPVAEDAAVEGVCRHRSGRSGRAR